MTQFTPSNAKITPLIGWVIVIGIIGVFALTAVFVAGLGVTSGILAALLVLAFANQFLPAPARNQVIGVGIVAGFLIAGVDLLSLSFRLAVPNLQTIFLVLIGIAILWNGFFIVRGVWQSNRLRNRIMVIAALGLPPLLIGSTVFIVQTNRLDLEASLLERAKANAITGAAMIGKSLEFAIETGALTREQVFDRNYVKFLDFNPAADPNYNPQTAGAPETLAKYHTAYDAFTDQNWQELVDSFISPDGNIIFAIPVDVNGYLPTHNKRYSSGDGSAATDRTKRIFNDPVGIKAAQNTEPVLQQIYNRPGTGEVLWDISAPIYVNGEHWGGFRVAVQLAQNQQRIINSTWRASIAAFITLLAVLAFAWFLGSYISKPIENLTVVASQVAAGNLILNVTTTGQDEIAVLGQSFNQMILQLRDLISSLEQRIADRTRGLVLAAEVGRTVSQVRALDVMLKDAAELIRSRFDLYYVQVYLTNPSQTALILQSGTGTVGAELVGRAHQLPLNTSSINGRAAIEKKSVVISDTTSSPTFKPNPLLPETRSEMAVPLLIGEKVVGVLDMQSQEPGKLNQDILTAFEALAGQLAIAVQNATFLAETEQAHTEVEAQARRLSRANWADYLDAVHKPEEIGFVFEQNKVTPMTQEEPVKENALTASITVTGETLGNLVVDMEGRSPIAQGDELVNAVARQVSQQIESLRLLESAERYRFEAEQASRRLTREGWKDYTNTNADKGLSYIYDLKEVRTYNQIEDQQTEESAFSLPLKVRDETVGRLVIQCLEPDNKDALELANAVAERLGAHIEGLRQYDQTQSALAQTEKLYEASRAITATHDEVESVTELVKLIDHTSLDRVVAAMKISDDPLTAQVVAVWDRNGMEDRFIGNRFTDRQIPLISKISLDEATLINDFSDASNIDLITKETFKALGVKSAAILPISSGGNLMGWVLLETTRAPRQFGAEVRSILALVGQSATVIQGQRLLVQSQKQAEREAMLNAISQKIQSATSVEAVLQIAARELGHALGAPRTIAQLSMKDSN